MTDDKENANSTQPPARDVKVASFRVEQSEMAFLASGMMLLSAPVFLVSRRT